MLSENMHWKIDQTARHGRKFDTDRGTWWFIEKALVLKNDSYEQLRLNKITMLNI